ncbi:hypothetical protein [Paenibacillus sp. Soil750]|nr:hypothetical protein [Paenibacillus sp. Soil750]
MKKNLYAPMLAMTLTGAMLIAGCGGSPAVDKTYREGCGEAGG